MTNSENIRNKHVNFFINQYKDLNQEELSRLVARYNKMKAAEPFISPLFQVADGMLSLDTSSADHLNLLFREIEEDLNIIYDELQSIDNFMEKFDSELFKNFIDGYSSIINRAFRRITFLEKIISNQSGFDEFVINNFDVTSNRTTEFSRPDLFRLLKSKNGISTPSDATIDELVSVLRLSTKNRKEIVPAFFLADGRTSIAGNLDILRLVRTNEDSQIFTISVNLGQITTCNRLELNSSSAYPIVIMSLSYRLEDGSYVSITDSRLNTELQNGIGFVFDPIATNEFVLEIKQSNFDSVFLTPKQQGLLSGFYDSKKSTLWDIVEDKLNIADNTDITIPDEYFVYQINLDNIKVYLDEYQSSSLYLSEPVQIKNLASVALDFNALTGDNSFVIPLILIEDLTADDQIDQVYILANSYNGKHTEVLNIINNQALLDLEPVESSLVVYVNGIRTTYYNYNDGVIIFDRAPGNNSVVIAEYVPAYLNTTNKGKVYRFSYTDGQYEINTDGQICLNPKKIRKNVVKSNVYVAFLISSTSFENFSTSIVDSYSLSFTQHQLNSRTEISPKAEFLGLRNSNAN